MKSLPYKNSLGAKLGNKSYSDKIGYSYMSDASIIAALIGLVGTLVVTVIGFRQWKQQQITNNRQDYQFERKTAYKQLWNLLPDLSSAIISYKKFQEMREASKGNNLPLMFSTLQTVRDIFPDEAALEKCLSDIKLFYLKNAPYIDEGSQYLAVEYIENLIEAKKELSQFLVLSEDIFKRAIIYQWLEELEKMPPPKLNNMSLEIPPTQVHYSGIPEHVARQIPPMPLFDLEDDDISREESNKKIVGTEFIESPTVITSIVPTPPSNNNYTENSSMETLIADKSKTISSFVHLSKIRLSEFAEILQIKWMTFAFSNPTPFRIKLTEIFVPAAKQECKTIQSMHAVMKSREKLLTEIKQVISGEKV